MLVTLNTIEGCAFCLWAPKVGIFYLQSLESCYPARCSCGFYKVDYILLRWPILYIYIILEKETPLLYLLAVCPCLGDFEGILGPDPSVSKSTGYMLTAMIGENRQLVTNELVEFEE